MTPLEFFHIRRPNLPQWSSPVPEMKDCPQEHKKSQESYQETESKENVHTKTPAAIKTIKESEKAYAKGKQNIR